MAKTLVVNEQEQTRVPFLRGILTRSLQEAGLSFEDAYGLASKIRDALSEQDQITTDELRAEVAARLRKNFESKEKISSE